MDSDLVMQFFHPSMPELFCSLGDLLYEQLVPSTMELILPFHPFDVNGLRVTFMHS
jgi:hypothetical protein